MPGSLHGTGGGKAANLLTAILRGTSDGASADSLPGTDNDPAAGSVHQADCDGGFIFSTEDEGYRIAITGTLKGNAASGVPDANFSVASALATIGGCRCSP